MAILSLHPAPDEKEAKEFYFALGCCVNAWAFVDRQLYSLAQFSLKMSDKQTSFFFYQNRAFNQRLHFVDSALRMAISKEQFDTLWTPAHDRSKELSNTRNILAHHPAKRTAMASRDDKPLYIYTIHIEPYERILNREYKGLKGKTELDIDDLKEHLAEVESLVYSLGTLVARLRIMSRLGRGKRSK